MPLVDVLAYDRPDGETEYRATEAGRGAEVVRAHEREHRKRRLIGGGTATVLVLVIMGYALLIVQQILLGLLVTGGVVGVYLLLGRNQSEPVPRLVETEIRQVEAEKQYDLDATV